MNWISDRLQECDDILRKLITAPYYAFNEQLKKTIPLEHGVYAISKCGVKNGEYLHVGISKRGANGLKGRVWEQHFKIGGSSGDLIEKVKRNADSQRNISISKAREWIIAHCQVQWVVLNDPELRRWAEHYVLSALRPIWGH